MYHFKSMYLQVTEKKKHIKQVMYIYHVFVLQKNKNPVKCLCVSKC